MNLPPRTDCDADVNAISIEEALDRIQSRLPRLERHETINCSEALGRVTASKVHSPISVPPFRASAMDGYALRVSEAESPLIVEGQSYAGHPGPDAIGYGSCQRITTGARVPDDADAVVQQENVEIDGDTISINKQPSVGLNIRLPGSDSQQGDELLEHGIRIGAAQIALLAAHGITKVKVHKQIHVAVFSTGDELINPPDVLQSGQIYDANRSLLIALISNPAIRISDLGICKDSKNAIENLFEQASDADLVISSGGVSVGDADHVRAVLEQSGRVDLWKIAMKPGRPLTFGFSKPSQAFFGLPGNPVSAALTALLFVKPAMRSMLQMEPLQIPKLQLPLASDIFKLPGRVEYQRAVICKSGEGAWQVSTTGLQDSHVLSSLNKANCLIELPIDSTGGKTGDIVQVIPFSHFAEAQLQ
ncbi:MAG: gephyrin-like molybdotransferase Glp [Granulosicoccus sp.]